LLVISVLGACAGEVALAERPELQGMIDADVAQLIEEDDTGYDSTDDEVLALQRFTKGWSACRAVYEAYAALIRTGELPPQPEPISADEDIPGTSEDVGMFIRDLYRPMAEGDPDATRDALADSLNCGSVPVSETGDRSETIAEALGAP
jgi:hypothetical protein